MSIYFPSNESFDISRLKISTNAWRQAQITADTMQQVQLVTKKEQEYLEAIGLEMATAQITYAQKLQLVLNKLSQEGNLTPPLNDALMKNLEITLSSIGSVYQGIAGTSLQAFHRVLEDIFLNRGII